MTTPYLIAHPPRLTQFRRPRREAPSGVCVVHTAESTPDWVGPDAGAESVARFIQGRDTYGSYHDLVDSDTIVQLVPYDAEAYGDGTGSNPHAYHVSAATQAAKWGQAPREWREATVRNMAHAAATYARWIKRTEGVTIPARRITRAQSEARVPGFISHGERDPGRRTDPGTSFPWDLFLSAYSAELNLETDDMPDMKELKQELAPVIVRELLSADLFPGEKRGSLTVAQALRSAGNVARLVRELPDKVAAAVEAAVTAEPAQGGGLTPAQVRKAAQSGAEAAVRDVFGALNDEAQA